MPVRDGLAKAIEYFSKVNSLFVEYEFYWYKGRWRIWSTIYKINNMIDINAYNISEDHRNLIIPDIIEFIKFIKHM